MRTRLPAPRSSREVECRTPNRAPRLHKPAEFSVAPPNPTTPIYLTQAENAFNDQREFSRQSGERKAECGGTSPAAFRFRLSAFPRRKSHHWQFRLPFECWRNSARIIKPGPGPNNRGETPPHPLHRPLGIGLFSGDGHAAWEPRLPAGRRHHIRHRPYASSRAESTGATLRREPFLNARNGDFCQIRVIPPCPERAKDSSPGQGPADRGGAVVADRRPGLSTQDKPKPCVIPGGQVHVFGQHVFA